MNKKHAEMNLFVAKYYPKDMVQDREKTELEVLFSMMDYLGFKYVGV